MSLAQDNALHSVSHSLKRIADALDRLEKTGASLGVSAIHAFANRPGGIVEQHFGRDWSKELADIKTICDAIGAAILAKQSGDTTALQQHVATIDQQISDLQGKEAGDEQQIADIHDGLQSIADKVSPAPTPTPQPTPAPAQATAAAPGGSGTAAQPTPPANSGTVDTSTQQPPATPAS